MIQIEFSPEVDVKVQTDAAGRTTLQITPKFYSRRSQVALLYATTMFKPEQREKFMLKISGATGQLHFRSAAKAVEPLFLAPDAPADKKGAGG